MKCEYPFFFLCSYPLHCRSCPIPQIVKNAVDLLQKNILQMKELLELVTPDLLLNETLMNLMQLLSGPLLPSDIARPPSVQSQNSDILINSKVRRFKDRLHIDDSASISSINIKLINSNDSGADQR